jgi:hypothetical protein
MNRPFLTPWAQKGFGVAETLDLSEAIISLHDIFLHSARKRHDVMMVCGSLNRYFRDELWRDVSRHTFAYSLSEVLEAGGKVRILLANDPVKDEPMSSGILSLLNEFSAGDDDDENDGTPLLLHATGRPDFLQGFPHFTVTNGGTEWLVRLEREHGPIVASVADPALKMRGYLLGGDDANRVGKLLSGRFYQLFDDSGKRAARRESVYYAMS